MKKELSIFGISFCEISLIVVSVVMSVYIGVTAAHPTIHSLYCAAAAVACTSLSYLIGIVRSMRDKQMTTASLSLYEAKIVASFLSTKISQLQLKDDSEYFKEEIHKLMKIVHTLDKQIDERFN